MSKLPKLSGKEIVKILVEKFGFEVVRQKGSHVVLRKFKNGEKIVTIVPMHRLRRMRGAKPSFRLSALFRSLLKFKEADTSPPAIDRPIYEARKGHVFNARGASAWFPCLWLSLKTLYLTWL